MKRFVDLSEAEILALAIASEEEDARIYRDFAIRLRPAYPATADAFVAMAEEEHEHRHRLVAMYRKRFGETMPSVTRRDVRGFLERNPIGRSAIRLLDPLRLEAVRGQAAVMEAEAASFYARAADTVRDVDVRALLADLAEAEQGHRALATQLKGGLAAGEAGAAEEATRRRLLLLQVVQPGLAGLIDGSVSTLAPIFAAAFATMSSWETFLVGLAASVGAGISMGLTEALSDDGAITDRGHPWLRGAICGVMTALGGLGHTVPYLIPDFWTATSLAALVVVVELFAIAWIRWRYMATPFGSATVQVVLGGLLVLLAGMVIGSA
ncbi:iron exporter MbfA [Marinivivus vitaminiproducens]|uniref:iron exporter MbfA n=1 Tax=Marinivivus vitaminiproducens TaxID=3035935 RepID=UPI0027A13F3D|nr:ferritin family protein [Geminicoccaceae bacterium SCSIO 64248]